jgi:hypothetical protein
MIGMHCRNGTTLVEVLVAIFVMGIGCLAILALFPLAALTMARGIKDDRVGHSAANAKAIAVAHNIRFDGNVNAYFDNASGSTTTSTAHDNATFDGPSWPVYADPIGFTSYTIGNDRDWVATKTDGIRRRPLSFAAASPTTLKWCSLLDDITFLPNGQPSTSGGSVERAGSYSWAWLLRRPRAGIKSVCELTVVVYEQRALSTTVKLGAKEQAYAVTVNATQPNVITLSWNPAAGQVQPQVREGGWILDATAGPPKPNPNPKLPPLFTPGNAAFYRVVSVGDINVGATSSSIDVELAAPMRDLFSPMQGPALNRTVVVMDGVAEVIDCGTGWRSWSN